MIKNTFRVLLFFITFLASQFHSLSLCAQPQNNPPSQTAPLKIGVIQSLTGIAAEYGKTVVQALKLAAEDINKSQINSTKIELLIEDDQSTSKNTVSAFHKLKGEGVSAFIGATWDFTTNAVIPLAKQHKMVLFSTSTSPDALSLTQGQGFAFANYISVKQEANAFAQLLKSGLGKSAIFVYVNNSWGEVQRKTYKEILESQGVTILAEETTPSYDTNDWASLLPRIKSKHADLIILLLNKYDLDLFLRRARETDLSASFYSSINAFDAFHSTSFKNLYEDLCFPYPYEQLESEKAFVEHYKRRFNEAPKVSADNTYDALFIIAKAHNLSKERKISIQEALLKVEYSGLVGHYSYTEENSFSLGKHSLMCIKKGELMLK